MAELAEQWQRQHPDFHFVPVLSDLPADDPWPGRRGLVHQAMLEDFPDMRGYELYACGSVAMAESAVPAFLAQGLDEDSCHADVIEAPGVNTGDATDRPRRRSGAGMAPGEASAR